MQIAANKVVSIVYTLTNDAGEVLDTVAMQPAITYAKKQVDASISAEITTEKLGQILKPRADDQNIGRT